MPILVADELQLAIWEEGLIPALQEADAESESEVEEGFDPVATVRA